MPERARVAEILARAGCVASEEEAEELLSAAAGDDGRLTEMVRRRVSGEPTAWIVGRMRFCGLEVKVHPGVYVPRWQSEQLTERAVALLPEGGVALDVCTGCGAVAAVMQARRPKARAVATDNSLPAIECALDNGVEAYFGDLTSPVPPELLGRVDVFTGVVPYVPREALRLLARDVRAFEPAEALDGGAGGTRHLLRAARQARRWLRPGGTLLLELGGDQGSVMDRRCQELGFVDISVLRDEEGDVRAVEARRSVPGF